jgi:hypothetical protein
VIVRNRVRGRSNPTFANQTVIAILACLAEDVEPETREFIRTYISSVELLEILLLVSGRPEKFWSLEEVHHGIQSSYDSVTRNLATLAERGFLKTEGKERRYVFCPKTPELAEGIRKLAKAYRERRVRVIELVYAPSPSAASLFSKAFDFRKEKDG